MRALVVGGRGFIGSHVVDELVAQGHGVVAFDRSPVPEAEGRGGVSHVEASLGDIAALEAALVGVDVVYHLVSTTVPSTSNLDPVADIEGNLVATVRLLNLMVAARVPRIVYFSSGGTVYGEPVQLPVPEDHPLNPISSYGVVKVAIEKYLGLYQHLHGIQAVILRPSNPYGPRQAKAGLQGIVGTCLLKLKEHQAIDVWGDGEVVRDYIYVSDLARLSVLAGHASAPTGTFNAGSGEGASVNDIIRLAEHAAGWPLAVHRREARAFDVRRVVLAIDAARDAFGWSPRTGLAEGIALTWASLSP